MMTRERVLASARLCLVLAAIGAIPWLLACDGPRTADDERRPNVLLIVVDTLRRGELGAYGYGRDTSPNVDRLAADGVRYDRAFSQAAWTTPSIASLMASRYPSQIGIQGELTRLGDELLLLPEVLSELGYATGGVVSHSFCSRKWNFDQGFDYWDQSSIGGHKAITSQTVTEKALDFLGLERDRPFFLFLHYFDPHVAYVEHDAHRFGSPGDYAGPAVSGVEIRELRQLQREGRLNEADLDRVVEIYDSEVAFTDRHLASVLGRLEELGLYDDTLVVVTGDHGEGFGEHGLLGHAASLYNELVGVPLVVKYPEGTPGVTPGTAVADSVALIDIFPTVLEVTAAPVRPPVEGRVLPPLGRSGPRPVFTENARHYRGQAVVVGDLKLIHNKKSGELELYDLGSDPDELAELGRLGRPEGLDELRRILFDWSERMSAEAGEGGGEVSLTPAEKERLRSLGYLDD